MLAREQGQHFLAGPVGARVLCRSRVGSWTCCHGHWEKSFTHAAEQVDPMRGVPISRDVEHLTTQWSSLSHRHHGHSCPFPPLVCADSLAILVQAYLGRDYEASQDHCHVCSSDRTCRRRPRGCRARAGCGLHLPVPDRLQLTVLVQHEAPHHELLLDPRQPVLHHDRHRESRVEVLRHCAWIVSLALVVYGS